MSVHMYHKVDKLSFSIKFILKFDKLLFYY